MRTILTVDDSPSMRQMVALTLSQRGHKVIEAVDGRDALNKISGEPVHMIITDLNMPNMDGLQLIQEARTLPQCRFIPIVMLTTESQPEKKQAGRAAGATGWIVKPFTRDQLLAVVDKVLR